MNSRHQLWRRLAHTVSFASLAFALGLSACTSYRVADKVQRPELQPLASTRVGIETGDLRIKGSDVSFRVFEVFDRRYQKTTRTERTVTYSHDSLIADVWNEEMEREGPHAILVIPCVLPLDLIAWLFTGPYSYIAGSMGDASPEPEVIEVAAREREPLGEDTEVGLRIVGDSGKTTFTVERDGWIHLHLGPVHVTDQLAAGRDRFTVELWRPGAPDEVATAIVGSEPLFAMADKFFTGSKRTRRDEWREIYDACPESASEVRNALWARLEPLEREIPFSTEVVRLEIAEQRLQPGGVTMQIKVRTLRRHRAGTSKRYTVAPPKRGSELAVAIGNVPIDLRLPIADRGWTVLTLQEGAAIRALKLGQTTIRVNLSLPEEPDKTVSPQLPLSWLIDSADAEIVGSEQERLLAWHSVRTACPTHDVRRAILKHIAPLQDRVDLTLARNNELADADKALQATGSADPHTTAAREQRLQAQANRGALLQQLGRYQDAKKAFGEAARHASDGDDLDALEQLIQKQLAAKKAGK